MNIFPEDLIMPQRTLSGAGRIQELLEYASSFGERGMVVHGASLKSSGKLDRILAEKPAGMDVATFQHSGSEPTLSQAESLRQAARDFQVDWLAAVGGGSVLDLAKVAAGMYNSNISVEDHHQGETLDVTGVPFLAVPTTAGTGSEATIVSVLIDSRRQLKKSVRHPSYMARVVVLDPELLETCPARIIAYSGLDALAQGIESYISREATWLSRQFSAKSVELVASSLESVYKNRGVSENHDLILGSYMAGIALSTARLGVIHGLVHPLGARYGLPHGLLCGVTLPLALELNRGAMGSAYDELSKIVGRDLITIIRSLLETLDLADSPLAGKDICDRETIVRETLASGSTKANPKTVTPDDVSWLLEQMFG